MIMDWMDQISRKQIDIKYRQMGQIHETRGYVTGFNYWNSFASAGANFYLTESITIGANYQYGLNDMTRPGVFALSTIDRPSRINGYLRFRIF